MLNSKPKKYFNRKCPENWATCYWSFPEGLFGRSLNSVDRGIKTEFFGMLSTKEIVKYSLNLNCESSNLLSIAVCIYYFIKPRSSHQRCIIKKAIVKSFAIFTGVFLWMLRNFQEHVFLFWTSANSCFSKSVLLFIIGKYSSNDVRTCG